MAQQFVNIILNVLMAAAMIVPAVMVSGRIVGAARTMLWAGIALLVVTQFTGVLQTALLLRMRMPTPVLSAIGIGSTVVSTVGTVLLILAIGQAVRAGRQAGGDGPSWPAQGQQQQPGWTQPGAAPLHSTSAQPWDQRGPTAQGPSSQPGFGNGSPGHAPPQWGAPDGRR